MGTHEINHDLNNLHLRLGIMIDLILKNQVGDEITKEELLKDLKETLSSIQSIFENKLL